MASSGLIWNSVIYAQNTPSDTMPSGLPSQRARPHNIRSIPTYIGLRVKRYRPSVTNCWVRWGVNGLTVVFFRKKRLTLNSSMASPAKTNAITTGFIQDEVTLHSLNMWLVANNKTTHTKPTAGGGIFNLSKVRPVCFCFLDSSTLATWVSCFRIGFVHE